MNEFSKVLDRCIAKQDESKSHSQNPSEKTSAEVSELQAQVKRRLAYSLLRLKVAFLILEATLLFVALRERNGVEQPTEKIESVADFEAALLGR
jgi:hypothetical protein